MDTEYRISVRLSPGGDGRLPDVPRLPAEHDGSAEQWALEERFNREAALEVGLDKVPWWAFAIGAIGLSISFWRLPNGLAVLAIAGLLAGMSHRSRKKAAMSLVQGRLAVLWQQQEAARLSALGEVLSATLSGLDFPHQADCTVSITADDECDAFLTHPSPAQESAAVDDFHRLARESALFLGRAMIASAPGIRSVQIAGTIGASNEPLYELEVTRESLEEADLRHFGRPG